MSKQRRGASTAVDAISERGGSLATADSELATAAPGGQLDAFEELYRRYMPAVLAYMQSVIPSLHEAEDLAAESLVRGLERFESFDPRRGSFLTWVLAIGRNLSIDHFRRQRADLRPNEELDLAIEQSLPDDAFIAVADEWIEDPRLARSLERLPLAQRQVIVLRYLIGLSNEECARVLGKTAATVRKHHSLALASLARTMGATPKGATIHSLDAQAEPFSATSGTEL